jgi:hypothetical protein
MVSFMGIIKPCRYVDIKQNREMAFYANSLMTSGIPCNTIAVVMHAVEDLRRRFRQLVLLALVLQSKIDGVVGVDRHVADTLLCGPLLFGIPAMEQFPIQESLHIIGADLAGEVQILFRFHPFQHHHLAAAMGILDQGIEQ